MKKLIIFNWKMAPNSLKEAALLFKQTRIYADKKQINVELVIAPPFVYLEKLAASVLADRSSGKKGHDGLSLASQDVFWEEKGAYTGEISPLMLKNLGVEYVIIGHSERRQYLNETDEMINKKVLAALKAGLKIVLCVGELNRKSQSAKRQAQEYVKFQLSKDLKKINDLRLALSDKLVVAYEPVWAIGTGVPCRPEDAVEIISYIRSILNSKFKIQNSKLLYGGSVDSKNIQNFLKYKEIDGALVGGASLKAVEVKKIIESASK